MLSKDKRNKYAKDVAEYWKNNCTDEEFYQNCEDTIEERLTEYCNLPANLINKECNIIMELIREIYSKDNWKAINFFNDRDIIIIQDDILIINSITFYHVYLIRLVNDKVILFNSADEEISSIQFTDIKEIEVYP